MDIFFACLEAMIFLVGIGVVGFIILAGRVVDETIIKVLSPLVLLIAVPCMVFSDILAKFDPRQIPEWWYLPLLWAGFSIATIPPAFAAGLLVPREARREFTVSLLYPNAIFVPFAVLSGVFGARSLLITELFLLTMFFPAVMFNTFDFFFPGNKPEKKSRNAAKVLHPVVIATLCALFLRILDLQAAVPGFIVKIAQSLGTLAVPLIMLLIGGAMYVDFRKKGKIRWKIAVFFIVVKNAALPAVTLCSIWFTHPSQSIAILLFLQSAAPPVTAIPVLTERVGGDAGLTNQFLLGSFAASVVSIPAGMLVLQRLYPGIF
jgi:malate permease and related proteins